MSQDRHPHLCHPIVLKKGEEKEAIDDIISRFFRFSPVRLTRLIISTKPFYLVFVVLSVNVNNAI
jgi:hypothetical protein